MVRGRRQRQASKSVALSRPSSSAWKGGQQPTGAQHRLSTMSPPPPTSILSFFFHSLLLCSSFLKAYGGAGNHGFHVATVHTLLPTQSCSAPTASSEKNSLTISHRYGPCSPLGRKHKSGLDLLLLQDQLRATSLQQRLRKNLSDNAAQVLQASAAALPARRGSSLGTGNYVVTVGLGTPRKDQTVVFDTGSTVSWVQCRPCARFCHAQGEPLFDPTASTSYRNVSCAAAACAQLDTKGCSAGTCLYGVRYGDNSSTVGVLGRDVLTLAPSEKVMPDFIFGCGQNNQGLFGRTAGLFGLSRDPLSLASQAASNAFGTVFSYCLPAAVDVTGELNFGAPRSGASSISYTPMLTYPQDPSLYALELAGISVGGTRLAIAPYAFSAGGTIIDSGTVITRLPPSAYQALRTAFRSAMTEYKLGEPLAVLDTCYDLTGNENITVPTVSLHFGGGVDLNLGIPGILFIVDISQVCLAFAGNRDTGAVGIIGNIQQRTVEVVYDVGAGRIGFGPGTCG